MPGYETATSRFVAKDIHSTTQPRSPYTLIIDFFNAWDIKKKLCFKYHGTTEQSILGIAKNLFQSRLD